MVGTDAEYKQFHDAGYGSRADYEKRWVIYMGLKEHEWAKNNEDMKTFMTYAHSLHKSKEQQLATSGGDTDEGISTAPKRGRQYRTLENSRKVIESARENLQAKLDELEGQTVAQQKEDPDVKILYAELHRREGLFQKNINQYYKHPSASTRASASFAGNYQEYRTYLEDHPWKRYTKGQKKTTTAKLAQFKLGQTYDVNYKPTAQKTTVEQKEQAKKEKREKDEKDARDKADAERKQREKDRAVAEALAKAKKEKEDKEAKEKADKEKKDKADAEGGPVMTSGGDGDDAPHHGHTSAVVEPDGTTTTTTTTTPSLRGGNTTPLTDSATDPTAPKTRKQLDEEARQHFLTRIKPVYKNEMRQEVNEFLATLEGGGKKTLLNRARELYKNDLGEYPREGGVEGLSTEQNTNLSFYYAYLALLDTTTKDNTGHRRYNQGADPADTGEALGKKGTTAPDTTGDAIPVFGDEDGDGDIDMDDFKKKYAGYKKMRGSQQDFTPAQIEEGIRRGQQEQEAERQYQSYQEATGRGEARVDPHQTESKEGTKFEGIQAGIDQEFYYQDSGGAGAGAGARPDPPRMVITPQTQAQPATDFKTAMLNRFEQNTEDAGQIIEAKARSEKSLEQLRKEIQCFHLLYEDKLPSIKTPEHMKLYEQAMKSKNMKDVREHHKLMSDMIRAFYKVSNMRLGVIMSAESVFGGNVGNIPSMAGSFGLGVPIQRGTEKPTRIDRKKGRDRFSNATAGEINVIRGGTNTGKGVRQAIPRDLDKKPYVDDIPFPNYEIADAFRPRSYVRKRAWTNPQIKIKSGR